MKDGYYWYRVNYSEAGIWRICWVKAPYVHFFGEVSQEIGCEWLRNCVEFGGVIEKELTVEPKDEEQLAAEVKKRVAVFELLKGDDGMAMWRDEFIRSAVEEGIAQQHRMADILVYVIKALWMQKQHLSNELLKLRQLNTNSFIVDSK